MMSTQSKDKQKDIASLSDRQFPTDKGDRTNRQFPWTINLKFTRQKPLDEYIVDFYCAELMLAIEIDGDTHAGQKQYDKDRTKNLNKFGIEIIRYTNAEVLSNLEGVYQDLYKRISARKPPKFPSATRD